MSVFSTRLTSLRQESGFSQEQIAQKLGVTKQTVSNYERGVRNPDNKMLVDLSLLYNCSVDYLLGKTDSRIDDDLLDILNTIPNDLLVEHGNILESYRAMGLTPISGLHCQRVPMIGGTAAGQPIYDPEEIGIYVDSPVDADAAMTVQGDSMSPTYLDGDVIYIKCCPEVSDGTIAVVFLDNEATLKHIYKHSTGLTLTSDNSDYPPISVEFSDYNNVRIFGVPVGYTRMFKD